MRRRDFLKSTAFGAVGAGTAGCVTKRSEGEPRGQGDTTSPPATSAEPTATATPKSRDVSGTLRVATYRPFVDSPSSSPGAWLKKEFEKQYPDATIEWQTPETELNYFIERRLQGAPIDADVYVGLNTDQLITLDQKLGEKRLFERMGTGSLENLGHVKRSLAFDPKNRAIPYDTGYISLVYDENEIRPPATFDDLLKPAYRGSLIVENAQTSATGRAFLLWSIHAKGPDGYLEYWKKLKNNDVRILGSWEDAYNAYTNGEAPMVVSYSTDQVYAVRYDQDLSKHQVAFLDDQGYANPEGMAKFADADEPALADAFLDFMLSAEAQSKIAVLNVQFPATDWAELPKSFTRYAYEPARPVTYTYQQLEGRVDGWVDAWARQIASN